MYNKIKDFLEKYIGPLAEKLNQNKKVTALTGGMLSAMLITLAMSIFCIVGNLPIPGWTEFLKEINLFVPFQEMVAVTSGMMGIYMVVAIGYNVAISEKENGLIGGLLSLAFFLILIPLNYQGEMEAPMSFISTNKLGVDGMFIAMAVGLIVSTLYCWLMKKNLKIKLPESVPPMVTDSLSPTIVAMIIFGIAFALRVVIGLTPFGDIFNLINTIITKPFLAFGATPLSLIIVYVFINLMWFFGIHPSGVSNLYFSSVMPIFLADINAFLAGQPIPNLDFQVMAVAVCVGGTGCTLGLAINMLFAKSSKMKTLGKLSIIPNIFNINEPVIFGVPVMLNPIFLIPMVTIPIFSGIISFVFLKLELLKFDPTIVLPWATPSFVASFFNGGVMLTILVLVLIAFQVVFYYPFFKMADNKEYEEEMKLEKSAV